MSAVHTMEELHFQGNCLKGSRPILSFDAAFEQEPYLKVIKELFLHTFGVPQGHKKSKPFIDHVLSFSVADGKIWVRNYEIREVEKVKGEADKREEGETEKPKAAKPGSKDTDINLIEIGPRFVLTPIIIQEGSFGGPILYENKRFISPNKIRAELRKAKAARHHARMEQQRDLLARKRQLGLDESTPKKKDDLDTRELFA